MVEKGKKGCLQMFMKFLFSHVGLCGMVALYCVAGGFIFEHLEKKNEEEICFDAKEDYVSMETDTIQGVMNVIGNSSNKDQLALKLQGILTTFRDNSIKINYDGSNCSAYGLPDGPKYSWSWAGSLFFSVTVISTIGYGHIAPKTFWGRLVCIAYAVLGIPLMLLALANIGDALADVFRFMYSNVCCFGCCRKKTDKTTKVIQIKPTEKEPEAVWNSDTERIVKQSPKRYHTRKSARENMTDNEKHRSKSDTEGKTTKSGNTFNNIDESVKKQVEEPKKIKIVPLDKNALKQHSENKKIRTESQIRNNESDDDGDEDDDDDLDENVTIPLTVTLIVIAGYIFAGAVLFGLWEGWDWLQSAYFCFITLSTIGFGDVTPGTDFDNPQANAQLILGSIYVMFGMAILSMCFALMQDEIISKCKWIGEKLGIVDKEED